MTSKRFILIVIDSFGIGEMADVPEIRPADIGANTALHLLQFPAKKHWPNLLKLGLINAMDVEIDGYEKSEAAIFAKSNLKHFGADSYFGHQEISGTNPMKPEFTHFQKHIDVIEQDLFDHGYTVERVTRENISLLKVNNMICVGDNMETDLGQAINVVGALDESGFDMISEVGYLVRKHVKVPRVIAFGGSGVTINDLLNNILVKDGFIGIDAPGSGVYRDNYHVIHIGYGIDTSKQVPISLKEKGISNYFYGKVENIVYNPLGKNFACVDTADTMDRLIHDLKTINEGFFFLNIQETDLAGHAQDAVRYIDRLNVADQKIGEVMELISENDILLVMADHGNDPTIGHGRHTREQVPILIYRKDNDKLVDLGTRDTMADVGQTVAEFFGTKIPFGTSFLSEIES